MSRRSTPQKEIDLQAFPIKVFLQGLQVGFRLGLPLGSDPYHWIRTNVGMGDMEFYPAKSPYFTEGHVLLARTLEDAAKFLAAFPEFKIGDGTTSSRYSSPYVLEGHRRHGRDARCHSTGLCDEDCGLIKMKST